MALTVRSRSTTGAGSGVSARLRPVANQPSALALAAEAVGAQLAQTAVHIDNQDLANDDLERKASAVIYDREARNIKGEFLSMEGTNALGAQQETQKSLDDLRRDLISKTGSPRAKKMLVDTLAVQYQIDQFAIREHGRKQFKQVENETSLARQSDFVERAAESWSQPGIARGFIDAGVAEVGKQAQRNGLSDEAATRVKDEYLSNAHAAIIARLQVEDVEVAEAYLEANQDEIDYKTEVGFREEMKEPLARRQAAKDFAEIASSLPELEGSPGAAGKGVPVGSGGDIVRTLFPKATVTSTYRSPDHPLSKKNPGSWHTKSRAAVDLKPIPGMTFAQFVGEVESAGYSIIEALDETGKGRSKNATGDHWHIVIGQKTGAQSNAPRRWDKADIYRRIEEKAAQENWDFDRIEALKAKADREIVRDEELFNRRERSANRAASEAVLELGDSFTDIAQIPKEIRDNLSPDARASYIKAAESNRQPKEPPANGDTALTLKLMRILEPERFAEMNLGQYVGQVRRSEIVSLVQAQARLNGPEGRKDVSLRGAISSSINFYATKEMDLSPKRDRERFMRVHAIMENELRTITGGKRRPTDAELKQAFVSATRMVSQRYNTSFLGIDTGSTVKGKARFELEINDVPPAVRERIVSTYRREMGSDPTDEQIAQMFRKYKGRLW